VSISCVGRQGAVAAMLLATLLVEDVIADPPKPTGDLLSHPTTAAAAANAPAADTVAAAPAPAANPAAADTVAAAPAPAANPAAADTVAAAPAPTANPPTGDTGAAAPPVEKASLAASADRSAFDFYLDRLMRAESGGRDTAANPRSTALGPFQFIKSTFLDVARRHFGMEVQELSEDEILKLRTDRNFARRCAENYSRENLAFLAAQGLQPTFGHLRLAFLLGPLGAARVLQAPPAAPVADVLGSAVIRANPFMARMSASNLIAKTARDVGETAGEVDVAAVPQVRVVAEQPPPVAQPRPVARALAARHACNPKLASCRKFASLRQRVAKMTRTKKASRHVAKVAPSRALRSLSAGRRNTAETKRRGAGA
jgi:hypothetical protein